jgi:hypothetical protein
MTPEGDDAETRMRRSVGLGTTLDPDPAAPSPSDPMKALAARQERSASLVADLEAWMRAERAKLSRHAAVTKAMDYMLTRWEAFTRFLDDGRICLTNNAAERVLRGLALGRKSWVVRRIGARGRAGRSHVQPHPDRQAQRR